MSQAKTVQKLMNVAYSFESAIYIICSDKAVELPGRMDGNCFMAVRSVEKLGLLPGLYSIMSMSSAVIMSYSVCAYLLEALVL